MPTSAPPAPSPFLASKTRAKVLDKFPETSGIIYLKGDDLHERHDTDVELPFRQESNFMYVTGVMKPGFSVVIDVATRRAVLLAPVVSADEAMWNGPSESLETLKQKYDFDDVRYESDLKSLLSTIEGSHRAIVLPSEEGKALLGAGVQVEKSKELQRALTEARLTKFDFELERMRIANRVSSEAHAALMRNIQPGQNERELDALFNYEIYRRGCRYVAYGSIVGSEKNAATLHYGANNATVGEGLTLVDAGAEFECYAADITRTYPASGTYSPEARIIYEIVLAMQKAVLAAIRPGVEYEDLHRLAQRICAQGLLQAEILQGDLEAILKAHASAVFFPHGLGHSIGLDVHDVGGYPEGVPRIDEPGIRYLRMRRKLEEGMVITVEPGCYFNDTLISHALADSEVAKFINKSVLERYRGVGGVRIEDCVLVTKDGFENFTSVPKEVDEVSAVLGTSATA